MGTWTKFDFPPNFPRLSGGMGRNAGGMLGNAGGMLGECWKWSIATQEILKDNEKSYLSRKTINLKQ